MSKESISLKAGIDYPKNWDQFINWFHDEQSCLNFLKNFVGLMVLYAQTVIAKVFHIIFQKINLNVLNVVDKRL